MSTFEHRLFSLSISGQLSRVQSVKESKKYLYCPVLNETLTDNKVNSINNHVHSISRILYVHYLIVSFLTITAPMYWINNTSSTTKVLALAVHCAAVFKFELLVSYYLEEITICRALITSYFLSSRFP